MSGSGKERVSAFPWEVTGDYHALLPSKAQAVPSFPVKLQLVLVSA